MWPWYVATIENVFAIYNRIDILIHNIELILPINRLRFVMAVEYLTVFDRDFQCYLGESIEGIHNPNFLATFGAHL
jgi:hypothetical protein